MLTRFIPNLFTLGNLFLGMMAILLAIDGNYSLVRHYGHCSDLCWMVWMAEWHVHSMPKVNSARNWIPCLT